MEKSPYDIIRIMIEKIILPKYPKLKIDSIDSMNFGDRREYDVRIRVPKKLSPEIQMEIDTELKKIFKMASLDVVDSGKNYPNSIAVWFKTPNQKDWTFHSKQDYKHI